MFLIIPSPMDHGVHLVCWGLLDPLDVEGGEVDLDHEQVVVQVGLPRPVLGAIV